MLSRKEIWYAISAANFMMFGEWRSFLYPRNTLLIQAPHYAMGLFSLLVTIALISLGFAFILWVGKNLQNRYLKSIAYMALCTSFCFPLNTLRTLNNFPITYPILSTGFWMGTLGTFGALLLAVAAGAGLYYAFVRWTDRMVRNLQHIFFFLSGFAILTLTQATAEFIRVSTLDRPAEPALESMRPPERPRIIAMIFDEMGESYLAGDKRGKLSLPEFDKFRSESLYAVNAVAPGEITRMSIPAYLEGKKLEKGRDVTQENYFGKYFTPDHTLNLESQNSVFKDLQNLGYRTGMVGWYLPFCRLYGAFLNQCSVYSFTDYDYTGSVMENIGRIFPRNFKAAVHPHWQIFNQVMEEAEKVATDHTLDYVLLHWPVPHLPGIYHEDGSVGRWDTNPESEAAYRANFQLADKVLGQLRLSLEASGQWDNSIIIITSDHAAHEDRDFVLSDKSPQDRRVPFLLRLPHRAKRGPIETKLEMVHFRELIVALAQNQAGKISEILGTDLAPLRVSSGLGY